MGFIVVIVVGIVIFASVGLGGVNMAMITGAIGFALGSIGGGGWAIFGALLGGLIGVAGYLEQRKKG